MGRGTWSSMAFTPSGPSSSMAWPIRSVRPQLSIRKPRSSWNLSVAALASKRLKELKQHSGLGEEDGVNRNKGMERKEGKREGVEGERGGGKRDREMQKKRKEKQMSAV